ncbi:BZ3500_MvSof-1268-A1-R1_Chr1-3g02474 [Microbotryum saponariae]|uniref:BZ3500_MvSof-1268-A1-R1_Chr1-3g02474 protein n=1 Tax=Microbotryum saponariae TaxID=289078 RepID=A0A2X0KXF3_9BASI|nr:BZ3500_MvSof-1268-A1-R1_Chr1-3g02474 [Microbotryum saponariae]SCZ96334.1 BZ3501_MvSof-1269-A2-R1_Chr1-3g02077 [Microbotryum saponariae]
MADSNAATGVGVTAISCSSPRGRATTSSQPPAASSSPLRQSYAATTTTAAENTDSQDLNDVLTDKLASLAEYPEGDLEVTALLGLAAAQTPLLERHQQTTPQLDLDALVASSAAVGLDTGQSHRRYCGSVSHALTNSVPQSLAESGMMTASSAFEDDSNSLAPPEADDGIDGHAYTNPPSPELNPIQYNAEDELRPSARPPSFAFAFSRRRRVSTAPAAGPSSNTSAFTLAAASRFDDRGLDGDPSLMRSPPLIGQFTLANGQHGYGQGSIESTPNIVEIESSSVLSSSQSRPAFSGNASMMLNPENSSLFNPTAPLDEPPIASTSNLNAIPPLGPDGQPTVASLTISPMPFHYINFAAPLMESSFERTPMLDDPDHFRSLNDAPTGDLESEKHRSAADFSSTFTSAQVNEEAFRQHDAAKAARLLQYQQRMRQRMAAANAGKGKGDDESNLGMQSPYSGSNLGMSGWNGSDAARMRGPGGNLVRGRRTSSAASTLAMAVHAAKMQQQTPSIKDPTILPARPPHDLAPETRFNHIVLTTHWLDDNTSETISLSHLPEYRDLLDLPPEYLASQSLMDISNGLVPGLRDYGALRNPGQMSAPPSSITTQYPDLSFANRSNTWRGASMNYSDPALSALLPPPSTPMSTALTADALANGHTVMGSASALKRSRTSDGGSSRGSSKKKTKGGTNGRSSSPTPPPFEPTGEEPTTWQLQSTTCLSKSIEGHPKCHLCLAMKSAPTEESVDAVCAFRGVRSFGVDAKGSIIACPTILSLDQDIATQLEEQPQFGQSPKKEQADELRTAIAPSLGPLLERELRHASSTRAVRVPRQLSTTVLCTTCLIAPLAGDWICEICGRAACSRCYEALVKLDEAIQDGTFDINGLTSDQHRRRRCLSHGKKRVSPHSHTQFTPLTRINRIEMQSLLADVMRWKAEHPVLSHNEAIPSDQIASLYSDNPILASERPGIVLAVPSLTKDLWHQIWARNEPVLLDGAPIQAGGLDKWTPETFVQRFGDVSLTLENHKSGERTPTLASYFFGMYGQTKRDTRSWKVRNFPAKGLREALPELSNAVSAGYLATVPLPELLRPDGVLNPLSHVPLNALEPEVGPRCAFTWAGRGSTLLHNHINLMTYTSATASDVPGSARWDIFRYEDSDVVRAFILELVAKKMAKAGTTKAHYRDAQDDPLFTENVFLDASLRAELFKSTGIRPYTIWQGVGQFVVVPAGCAFQVTTFDDCLSYAHEFISSEHVARSLQIDALSRSTKRSERANAHLAPSLYWAWQSVTTSLLPRQAQIPQLDIIPIPFPIPNPTKPSTSSAYTALPPLPPIPGSTNVSPDALLLPNPLPFASASLSTLTKPEGAEEEGAIS